MISACTNLYLKASFTLNFISQKMNPQIMKNCVVLSALCVLLFQLTACKAQDPVNVDPNPVYEACCGAEPVEFSEGKGYVYVPNMFTPNRDGRNDVFQPVFDPKVIEYIARYTIYQDTTEEPGPGYYNSGTFDPNTNPRWWDGTLPDGTEHVGPFEYTIEFALIDGTYMLVEGRGCVVRCGSDAAEFTNRAGCYFASQATDGKFDKAAPNREDDCFK
jgi:hypothetical protein